MNLPSAFDVNQKLSLGVKFFKGIWKKGLSLGLALILAVVTTFTFNCNSALAVDRIILTYGDARETISIGDLREFVRQGVEPAEFRTRLGIADRDLEALRFALGQEIPVSREFLRRILNSTIGQFVLTRLEPVLGVAVEDNVSEVIDAFLAAADNDSFTLLELLDNYPQDQVVVSGPLLEEAYERISFIATDVLAVAEIVRTYLSDIVCDESLFGSEFQNQQVPELFSRAQKGNVAWPN